MQAGRCVSHSKARSACRAVGGQCSARHARGAARRLGGAGGAAARRLRPLLRPAASCDPARPAGWLGARARLVRQRVCHARPPLSLTSREGGTPPSTQSRADQPGRTSRDCASPTYTIVLTLGIHLRNSLRAGGGEGEGACGWRRAARAGDVVGRAGASSLLAERVAARGQGAGRGGRQWCRGGRTAGSVPWRQQGGRRPDSTGAHARMQAAHPRRIQPAPNQPLQPAVPPRPPARHPHRIQLGTVDSGTTTRKGPATCWYSDR